MALNKVATENLFSFLDVWLRRRSTAHIFEWHSRFSEGRQNAQGHE
jgi:hypothetical protein